MFTVSVTLYKPSKWVKPFTKFIGYDQDGFAPGFFLILNLYFFDITVDCEY